MTISDHDEVEQQQNDATDKAPLLGKHCEDKIGMLRRQKIEPVLRAVQVTFAENPSRADGDLRLDDMISGAQRITIRIEKCQDAVALVRHEKLPSYRQKCQTGGDQ